MATINVKDAAGSTVALEKPLAAGQAVMTASRPVVIASDQSAVPVSLASVPSHAVTNAGTFAVQAATTAADGANVTFGAKADAKSTATDTTAVSAMSVWKQISASVQTLVTNFGAAWTRGAGAADSNTQRVTIDNTQSPTVGQAAASASVPVVQASDRQNSIAFAVAMTTDTSAYASGDLIADTQQLDAFFNKADGKGVVNSITIIEKDAQGLAYYILFHRTSTSMGTENSAPNISDANAGAGIQGIVAVAASDFVTVSGTKVATIRNIGLPVTAVSGTDDIYVSILNATGAPTYAGGTIDLIIGALLD